MKNSILKGIIYKINNAGTSDKVINIIDTLGSKHFLLAKGAKKYTSRKSSSIELANLVKVNFVEGYNVPIVKEILVENEFKHWKNDLVGMSFLQLILEIIDKFTFENNDDAELSHLLIETLEQQTEDYIYLSSIFVLKLLKQTGNLPELDQCLNTEVSINSETAFKAKDHIGYVSEESNLKSNKISPRIFKTQMYILQRSIEECIKVKLSDDENLEMFRLHIDWLEKSIEKELKSKKIVLSIYKSHNNKISSSQMENI